MEEVRGSNPLSSTMMAVLELEVFRKTTPGE
jgi:hypothetical protein